MLDEELFNKIFVFLGEREGVRYVVYKDTLGKLTGGIGHLLTDKEKARYRVGSKIAPAVVEEWFRKDVQLAFNRALDFVVKHHLPQHDWYMTIWTSVYFQLGNFELKFPNTAKLIAELKLDDAIAALKQSLWYKQTPVRVNDLIGMLEKWKSEGYGFSDRGC